MYFNISGNTLVFKPVAEAQFLFGGINLSLMPEEYDVEFLVEGCVSCDVFNKKDKIKAGHDHRVKFRVSQESNFYEFRERSMGGGSSVVFRGIKIKHI